MRKWWVCALLLSAPVQAQQQRDTLVGTAPIQLELLLDKGLLEQLGALWVSAANENKEAMRCGLGYVASLTVYVDLLHQPQVISADENGVYAQPCPFATVFEWHTHLPSNPPEFPGTKRCFLSITDQRNVLREGRVGVFHMVHASETMYCWWTYAQVMEHIRKTQLKQVMLPVRGQTSW